MPKRKMSVTELKKKKQVGSWIVDVGKKGEKRNKKSKSNYQKRLF